MERLRSILGRKFSQNLRIGLVGLPNVGKSALYNVLVPHAPVPSANYAFCTIDPSTGRTPVPTPHLDALIPLAPDATVIPAALNVTDIAGLVAGAADGEGLGNAFLANIRTADAIAYVGRCFADGKVAHVATGLDTPDPVQDMRVIETELALADLATLETALARKGKKKKGGPGGDILPLDAEEVKPVISRVHQYLQDQGGMLAGMGDELIALLEEHPEGAAALKSLHLLTAKPVVVVANVADDYVLPGSVSGEMLAALQESTPHGSVIPVPVSLEADLAAIEDPDEAGELLAMLGLDGAPCGSQEFVQHAYDTTLGLQSFYTCGEAEIRAWTIPAFAPAHVAARAIHSDIADNLVRTDAISVSNLVAQGSWASARSSGLVRSEGRDYPLQPDDVILFHSRP